MLEEAKRIPFWTTYSELDETFAQLYISTVHPVIGIRSGSPRLHNRQKLAVERRFQLNSQSEFDVRIHLPCPLQGHDDEAKPLYQRALGIIEAKLGQYHPSMAACANNFGTLLTKQVRRTTTRNGFPKICHRS